MCINFDEIYAIVPPFSFLFLYIKLVAVGKNFNRRAVICFSSVYLLYNPNEYAALLTRWMLSNAGALSLWKIANVEKDKKVESETA